MDKDSFKDIEDLPDDIYDVIKEEGVKIVNVVLKYVPELSLAILQNVFCSCIYGLIKPEERDAYLDSFRKASELSFKKWDEQED